MTIPLITFVDVDLLLVGANVEVFGFASALGAFTHTVTSNRVDGPYFSLAEVTAAGFTSGVTPEINAWASAVFAQTPHVQKVKIGRRDAADPNWTTTMDLILAADNDWYFLCTENRDEADINLVAAWTETNGNSSEAPKIYIPQSQDAAILAGTPGHVGLDLQAASYLRSALLYHRFSDANDGAAPADGYADGAWVGRCGGFNLDAPNGAGNWVFKTLSSITFDPVTPTQAAFIYAANANVYGRTKGSSFTSKGQMAQGRRIDVTTSLDWGRVRIGEKILAEFVGEPIRIPFTNAGINRMKAAAQAVLEQGVVFGHFSPDFPRVISAPKVQEVSTADKIARVITMTGNVVLAGAIEKAIFDITVQQ